MGFVQAVVDKQGVFRGFVNGTDEERECVAKSLGLRLYGFLI